MRGTGGVMQRGTRDAQRTNGVMHGYRYRQALCGEGVGERHTLAWLAGSLSVIPQSNVFPKSPGPSYMLKRCCLDHMSSTSNWENIVPKSALHLLLCTDDITILLIDALVFSSNGISTPSTTK